MKRRYILALCLTLFLPMTVFAAQGSVTHPPQHGHQTSSEPSGSTLRKPVSPVDTPDVKPKQNVDTTGLHAKVVVQLTALKSVLESDEDWADAVSIYKPADVRFRWVPTPKTVTSVKWRVTEGSANTAGIAKELAKGAATSKTFSIDFAKFVPKYPPAKPHAYYYRVTVLPVDSRGKQLGSYSSPVIVTYEAQPEDSFVMGCTKNADCGSAGVCNLLEQKCTSEVKYRCEAEHIIVGTDGTNSKCDPYKCEADHCRTTCGSIDNCAEPYLCNSENKCVLKGTN